MKVLQINVYLVVKDVKYVLGLALTNALNVQVLINFMMVKNVAIIHVGDLHVLVLKKTIVMDVRKQNFIMNTNV